jgi:hypothetical protein
MSRIQAYRNAALITGISSVLVFMGGYALQAQNKVNFSNSKTKLNRPQKSTKIQRSEIPIRHPGRTSPTAGVPSIPIIIMPTNPRNERFRFDKKRDTDWLFRFINSSSEKDSNGAKDEMEIWNKWDQKTKKRRGQMEIFVEGSQKPKKKETKKDAPNYNDEKSDMEREFLGEDQDKFEDLAEDEHSILNLSGGEQSFSINQDGENTKLGSKKNDSFNQEQLKEHQSLGYDYITRLKVNHIISKEDSGSQRETENDIQVFESLKRQQRKGEIHKLWETESNSSAVAGMKSPISSRLDKIIGSDPTSSESNPISGRTIAEMRSSKIDVGASWQGISRNDSLFKRSSAGSFNSLIDSISKPATLSSSPNLLKANPISKSATDLQKYWPKRR